MIKCPKCGAVERYAVGGVMTCAMPISWYDENNVYHCQDNNIYTSFYQCKNCGERYEVNTIKEKIND